MSPAGSILRACGGCAVLIGCNGDAASSRFGIEAGVPRDSESPDQAVGCPLTTSPLQAVVTDAVTGDYVCSATVTASGAGVAVSLSESETGASEADAKCMYSAGSTVTPTGEYTVVAKAPQYMPAEQSHVMVYWYSSCGEPEAPTLTFALVPQAPFDGGGMDATGD